MEEKIFYDSDNNIKLCGIVNKASADNIVVMCHGIRGNKEECGSFTYLAEKLQQEGYSSFRFDFNGHGESGGEDFEITISREISDLKNTINMLKEKGYRDFILLGGSFGASIVSLFPYNEFDCIKGIILWYGALNYDYIKYGNLFSEENKKVAQNDGFYISKSMNSGKKFKFGLELFNEIDEYKPYEKLRECDLPKLFVHGDKDSAVPYRLSKEVAEMCNNAKFELIENGEHTFQNSKGSIEKAVSVTVDFIKEISDYEINQNENEIK
ncbi:MAG: alpha/beta fold hydrolase [Clostridia bacterium]|nr:alpha/beta fold hydrolase [Clostridia bacterium]